jgi:ribosomal-protein-alanine N-acetyltransferase
VPSTVGPALPPGSLRAMRQPRLVLDDEVVLRQWEPERDVDVAVRAFADPDIQFWHTRRLDSAAEAREWLASWQRRWNDETDASWAVARTDTGEAVGQVGLRTVFLDGAQAQISYWMLPEARRQRLAVRAAHAVTEWAMTELGLQRVFLRHSVRNDASCAVAAAAGFALEGTLRKHALHSDGWHDFHVHARVVGEEQPSRARPSAVTCD